MGSELLAKHHAKGWSRPFSYLVWGLFACLIVGCSWLWLLDASPSNYLFSDSFFYFGAFWRDRHFLLNAPWSVFQLDCSRPPMLSFALTLVSIVVPPGVHTYFVTQALALLGTAVAVECIATRLYGSRVGLFSVLIFLSVHFVDDNLRVLVCDGLLGLIVAWTYYFWLRLREPRASVIHNLMFALCFLAGSFTKWSYLPQWMAVFFIYALLRFIYIQVRGSEHPWHRGLGWLAFCAASGGVLWLAIVAASNCRLRLMWALAIMALVMVVLILIRRWLNPLMRFVFFNASALFVTGIFYRYALEEGGILSTVQINTEAVVNLPFWEYLGRMLLISADFFINQLFLPPLAQIFIFCLAATFLCPKRFRPSWEVFLLICLPGLFTALFIFDGIVIRYCYPILGFLALITGAVLARVKPWLGWGLVLVLVSLKVTFMAGWMYPGVVPPARYIYHANNDEPAGRVTVQRTDCLNWRWARRLFDSGNYWSEHMPFSLYPCHWYSLENVLALWEPIAVHSMGQRRQLGCLNMSYSPVYTEVFMSELAERRHLPNANFLTWRADYRWALARLIPTEPLQVRWQDAEQIRSALRENRPSHAQYFLAVFSGDTRSCCQQNRRLKELLFPGMEGDWQMFCYMPHVTQGPYSQDINDVALYCWKGAVQGDTESWDRDECRRAWERGLKLRVDEFPRHALSATR